ncbi:MAG: alpha-L-fucosidase [Aquabacterium sp.]|nr:alpha-L-fucosidase [Aquabacterium sp.]
MKMRIRTLLAMQTWLLGIALAGAASAAPLLLDDPRSDFVINGEDLLLNAPGGDAWISVRPRNPVYGLGAVKVTLTGAGGLPVVVSPKQLSFNALNWFWPQKVKVSASALSAIRQKGRIDINGKQVFTGRTLHGEVQVHLENFAKQAYQPTVASLSKHRMPDWYKDAKLGYFVHWTVSSVPAYANPQGMVGFAIDAGALVNNLSKNRFYPELAYGEWYRSNMQDKKGQTWAHHAANFGASFDYYGFVSLFNAQQRTADVDGLARFIKDAGGKYTVFVTQHHDGVSFFKPSVLHSRLPTAQAVSERDVTGDFSRAVKNQGMKSGLYYSGYFDWGYSKKQFVHGDASAAKNLLGAAVEATTDQNFRALVRSHYMDLIDQYDPDLLWNDLAYIGDPAEVQAYFFNRKPDGVVNDRWKSPLRFYDSVFAQPGVSAVYQGVIGGLQAAVNAAGQREPITPTVTTVFSDFTTHEYVDFPEKAYPNTRYFENTRGVGRSFAYTANDVDFLSGDALVHFLVDVVSKNGNLLLNIGPRPDGSIPEEQATPIRELGEWLKVNGGGIYGTRPWREASNVSRQGDKLTYTTDRDGHLYVFVDRADAGEKVLTLPGIQVDVSVPATAAVAMLGRTDGLRWSQVGNDLRLVIPPSASSVGASKLVAIRVRLSRPVWDAYLASPASYWR